MALLWEHIKRYKRILILALVLATINQVFSLLDPVVFQHMIDDYASKPSSYTSHDFIFGVGFLLLLAVGAALVSRTAKNFQEFYVSTITQRVGADMYERSVKHTFELPYAVFEDRRSGEILQKLQKARTDTQQTIENMIGIVFFSCVGILFAIIYAAFAHWAVAVAYIAIIPMLGTATILISKRIKKVQRTIVLETAELAGSTTETIRNVELVKSLGLEEQEIKRLNSTNQKILELELKKIKLIRVLNFTQGTLINLLRSVLLLLMFYLIWTGGITLGQFFTLMFFSFLIFNPLSNIGTVSAQYQEMKASTEALEEILKLPPRPKPAQARKVGALQSIEYKGVSFTYQSGKGPSIDNASLKLERGRTIAFAGASGSGKSTLAKLLVGLYEPTKGTILINGVEHGKVDYDDLRSRIGFVSQETQLFAGTIRENLLFVNPNATDDDCVSALKAASVYSIVERGGKGLETKIGEGGVKLSGGERQRLAIARAILRKPELIIFDEATSSLDSLTEQEITKTIQDIKKSRPALMVVLIAHRLSTVTHSDTIYVLERGKIVEEGTHSQLVAKHGLYAAFWRQQTESQGKNSP